MSNLRGGLRQPEMTAGILSLVWCPNCNYVRRAQPYALDPKPKALSPNPKLNARSPS